MSVSETLNRAADLIEERGWQGGDGWGHNPESPLCLEGGLIVAAGIVPGTAYGKNLIAACPAARAVADYLQIDSTLWEWNDGCLGPDPSAWVTRTQAEIIEVLRMTALIEAAREEDAEVASILSGALSQPVTVFGGGLR